MAAKSVYIHIPFCKKICSYCDFCKVIYNKKWVVEYLKTLKLEIKDRYMGEEIETIYIGGGTPSTLSLLEIEYVLALTNLFNKIRLREFTFECNIEDINEELLALLKKYKVNRLSIGIESFNEEKLQFMKRSISFEDTKDKMNLIRNFGFKNVNLDLIYAIPNETVKVLKSDIQKLLLLNPDHISTYSLEVNDNTYLSYKNTKNIDPDQDFEMYEFICKKLKKEGYNHYEISNFAKEDKESRHNLTYWNNQEYYGFGCGASGYIDDIRYDNTRNLTEYIKGNYISKQDIMSKQDKMEYELILGLRKIDGINIYEFFEKFNKNIQDVFPVEKLLETGDLIYKGDNIKINPKKLYIMNEILLKLV